MATTSLKADLTSATEPNAHTQKLTIGELNHTRLLQTRLFQGEVASIIVIDFATEAVLCELKNKDEVNRLPSAPTKVTGQSEEEARSLLREFVNAGEVILPEKNLESKNLPLTFIDAILWDVSTSVITDVYFVEADSGPTLESQTSVKPEGGEDSPREWVPILEVLTRFAVADEIVLIGMALKRAIDSGRELKSKINWDDWKREPLLSARQDAPSKRSLARFG